jgi:hypothetical protein
LGIFLARHVFWSFQERVVQCSRQGGPVKREWGGSRAQRRSQSSPRAFLKLSLYGWLLLLSSRNKLLPKSFALASESFAGIPEPQSPTIIDVAIAEFKPQMRPGDPEAHPNTALNRSHAGRMQPTSELTPVRKKCSSPFFFCGCGVGSRGVYFWMLL